MAIYIFLNERSCIDMNPDDGGHIELAKHAVRALRETRALRRDTALANQSQIFQVQNGSRRTVLSEIFGRNRDLERALKRFVDTGPRIDAPITEEERADGILGEATIDNDKSTSATLVLLNSGILWSFTPDPRWETEFIQANVIEGDYDDNWSEYTLPILNIYDPNFSNSTKDSLTNFGIQYSANSEVYRTTEFKIVIYAYDHNPPHFHVMHPNITYFCLARFRIDTLEFLDSKVSKNVAKQIEEIARNNIDILKESWERRQNGDPPIRI